ncbi:MAG: nucleoside triphosphate pyrophosphohydrolase [Dehalococcoidia bacterium]|nr:nucleoside triphosphate pyrophosphohydrolase [Dehalococcoidia bacterium]
MPAPTFIATRTLVGCPAKLRYTGRQEKAALAPDFGDAYNHRVRSKKGQKHMDSQDFQDPGTYQTLEKVVGRLLGPGGCPWDREQTHQSLKRNLLEECYEFMEAIDSGDPKHMVEELGDILLQVAFHIQLAQEGGRFGPQEVFTSINEKLIRRHPHIFGDAEAHTAAEVKANWEDIKQRERGDSSSRLSSIPRDLPALAYAQLLQDRASLAGFDWDNLQGVLQKVDEEARELEEAESQEERESEMGDILFSLVNMGRWMSIQMEDSLRHSNHRFSRRFTDMESLCKERSIDFADLSLDEKEALWQEAKKRVD